MWVYDGEDACSSSIPFLDKKMNMRIGNSTHNINHSPSSASDVATMVAEINNIPLVIQRNTKFILDRTSGRLIIKILDTMTDTVIKEIPSPMLQKVYRNIHAELNRMSEQRDKDAHV